MKLTIKKKNGISLIEVIITILIIGISVSSISTLFLFGFNKNQFSNDLMRAEQLASSKIEFIRTLSSDSAILLNNTIENFNSINGYEKFKREIFVKPAISGDSNFLKIESDIYWQNERGMQQYKLAGAHIYN